jgi:3alpha(or 20beta)-hydroxysteroid dehydrogenase
MGPTLMGRVDGKVAIVTGGARGMGASHARVLVAEGATMFIADVLDDLGERLVRQIGGSARYVHLDVIDPDQWESAIATVTAEFGTVDVVVNNAGIVNGAPIQNFPINQWQRIIDVNLTGTFLGIRAVVGPMIAVGGGSIINVSSVAGLRGSVWSHGYVASKWAVRGLSKWAALELAPHNIRVNSIHPGHVPTAMVANLPDDFWTIPLGRPGALYEVSAFVLFLASDESSYATGTEFTVDGGLTADVPRRETSK